MEISRKTDYAIRMLAELVRSDEAIVSVRYAAEKNEVPYSFARSIQHDLVQAGIVTSVRGSRGGMMLAVDPRETTLKTIVEAIQGPICVAECDTEGPMNGACPFKESCSFSAIWCEAQRILSDFFESITLYQVVIEERCPRLRDGRTFVALTKDEYAALDQGAPTEE